MADQRITDLSPVAALQATDEFVISRAGGNNKILGSVLRPIGANELIYKYTVAGVDKASIDTGADTADAGTNDWTNGDVLEVWFLGRTDEATALANPVVSLNNDVTAIYDRDLDGANNATQQAASSNAAAGWNFYVHGATGSASYPGTWRMTIPNFTGTTFWKVGEVTSISPDATAGNQEVSTWGIGYRSTAAVTRLKIAGVGAAKLKVGSQLLIYKRLSS